MRRKKTDKGGSETLWTAFLEGDDQAFAQLYELNVDSMLYYGLHFTSMQDVVKDAIQDVFVLLYSSRNRGSLKPVENVKVYLYVALKNRLFAIFHKDMHYFHIDNIEPVFSMERSVEEKYIDEEQETARKQYIRQMLHSLSPRQREVVYYRFTEGMSYEEICIIMKMNYQSVRNLTHRSILKIRETYQEFDLIRYNTNRD
ncbi:sigma-70 family RNA polymerase sigma factor [Parabacteroides sp. OttesenSCG-928-G06]|nr:sigma-70 family RNA polymerase sigma factor [Parabacteroides sp. OttesenSCG-928-G06]